MRKLLILLLLGAFSTTVFSRPLDDDPIALEYRQILLEKQSGGQGTRALTKDQREEFLSQPLMKALISEYRKSMRKTGHPANVPDRKALSAFERLYKKPLLEMAMRPERVELKELVERSITPPVKEFDVELRQMEILGKIQDDLTIDLLEAYKDGNAQLQESYGALSVYVLTEAFVRVSLFNLGYKMNLSTRDLVARILTPDKSDLLLNHYWKSSNNPEHTSLNLALEGIERFSGKGFAELVTAYQTIFATERCVELLARHPRPEPPASDPTPDPASTQ
jgi:hypothetical protein